MTKMIVMLAKSHNPLKKFMVVVNNKIIHFGDSRYEDFTIHKDLKRLNAYIKRHKKKEDWSLNGIDKAGFWSRWLLWHKPNLEESIDDLKNRFGLKVVFYEKDWPSLSR